MWFLGHILLFSGSAFFHLTAGRRLMCRDCAVWEPEDPNMLCDPHKGFNCLINPEIETCASKRVFVDGKLHVIYRSCSARYGLDCDEQEIYIRPNIYHVTKCCDNDQLCNSEI